MYVAGEGYIFLHLATLSFKSFTLCTPLHQSVCVSLQPQIVVNASTTALILRSFAHMYALQAKRKIEPV